MNNSPKILIFSQPFNNFSGGGITLTNLFYGWPKEKLAVLTFPFMLQSHSTEVCDTYYQIGQEEYKWAFPLNLFKQRYPSGKIKSESARTSYSLESSPSFKHLVSSYFLNPVLEWLGLNNCNSWIIISHRLRSWLAELKPDLLYLQISNRESILFAMELIDYLRIPSVIHMMDDWPSTIAADGLLRHYWRYKISMEFRRLLDKSDLHLSISEAMSSEYNRRYKKTFKAFHNPVDISKYRIPDFRYNMSRTDFKILYFGRVGLANQHTISLFAKYISKIADDKPEIEFDIVTKDFETRGIKKLSQLRNVKVRPPVNHSAIPGLMMQYDLLLLPLDFTRKGKEFSKFSIPTKVSEYMLSGIPILVMAPKESAVTQFFLYHGCGLCTTSTEESELKRVLNALIQNTEFRVSICKKAYNTAVEKFDSDKVRHEFQALLINAVSSQ
jgi:glycosyltransferase involved in cell wall biosynthesis